MCDGDFDDETVIRQKHFHTLHTHTHLQTCSRSCSFFRFRKSCHGNLHDDIVECGRGSVRLHGRHDIAEMTDHITNMGKTTFKFFSISEIVSQYLTVKPLLWRSIQRWRFWSVARNPIFTNLVPCYESTTCSQMYY